MQNHALNSFQLIKMSIHVIQKVQLLSRKITETEYFKIDIGDLSKSDTALLQIKRFRIYSWLGCSSMFPRFDVPTVRCFDKCRNSDPNLIFFIFRVNVPTIYFLENVGILTYRNIDPKFHNFVLGPHRWNFIVALWYCSK